MAKNLYLSKLALFACFFALGVIALGAYTRLIDAGLGCPDWPGCYGHFTASGADYKAWAEMVHRYFVSGLSIFILVIIFIVFSKKEFRFRSNIILCTGLLLLLFYQIFLGQLTVTLKLLPIIVTQHLLGGFLILSMLWLVYLNNQSNLKNYKLKSLLPWTIGLLIILLIQITLGAWTSTNYASLSCPDFPFCFNDKIITMHFKQAFNIFSPAGVNYEGGVLPTAIRQTIQITHRFGALILTTYILIFTAFVMPKFKKLPELAQSMYLILGLLSLQLCIGISNVIFKLPLITAVSHNLVAALLLLSVITLTFKLVYHRVTP